MTTDAKTPVVPKTPVGANLLQAFQVVAKLGVDSVGEYLVVLAVHNVALSVEEPTGDFVLGWVLNDRYNALKLFGGEFTGAENALVSSIRGKLLQERVLNVLGVDSERESCGA